MNVKFEGLDKLYTHVVKVPSEFRQSLPRIVRQNTAELQGKAQSNAPVITGTLKRSIDIDIRDGGMTGVCRANAEYAGYVEYGTRFMAPRRYMKRAFDSQKSQFKADMERLMK